MSDARLRELERRVRCDGTRDARLALLVERLRLGVVSRAQIEVAAFAGHPEALAVVGVCPHCEATRPANFSMAVGLKCFACDEWHYTTLRGEIWHGPAAEWAYDLLVFAGPNAHPARNDVVRGVAGLEYLRILKMDHDERFLDRWDAVPCRELRDALRTRVLA